MKKIIKGGNTAVATLSKIAVGKWFMLGIHVCYDLVRVIHRVPWASPIVSMFLYFLLQI